MSNMLQTKQEITSPEKKLQETSTEFKKFFLLQFTKELIKHTRVSEITELKTVLKDEAKKDRIKKQEIELPQIIKKRVKEKLHPKKLTPPKKTTLVQPLSRHLHKLIPKPLHKPLAKPLRKIIPPPMLRIPETRLPPRFQYLKPIPTAREIDLGKLNPLIKDPNVKSIQCNGADKYLTVRTNIGTKPTNVMLSDQEIDSIIERFAESAKIPYHEGVFKAVVGRLIFSAIVSNVVPSKFIIQKMELPPVFRG